MQGVPEVKDWGNGLLVWYSVARTKFYPIGCHPIVSGPPLVCEPFFSVAFGPLFCGQKNVPIPIHWSMCWNGCENPRTSPTGPCSPFCPLALRDGDGHRLYDYDHGLSGSVWSGVDGANAEQFGA